MSTSFAADTDPQEFDTLPELDDEAAELELDGSDIEIESAQFPTFAELGASEGVIAALAATGVIAPFEIQARVIPDAIAGRDVLAKSRTGSGKTLAFAIPIVERLKGAPSRPAAVIMVPTRELCSQVTAELQIVAKPQVDRIATTIPTDRQTMFFSATLDGEVGILAAQYTREPRRHETISPRETVDSVEHRFVPVTIDGKTTALADLLSQEAGRALVFVKTKRGADRLVQRLKSHGITAAAMHGDLSQSQRERALASFDAGRVQTLIATDVAARGLDLDCITHVINFDPPEDDKAYVHRVGRTARAGRNGIGITFVLPDQEREVSRIAARLKLRDEFEGEGLKVAAPAPVYQSRRRGRSNTLLGRRPRRR